MAPFSVSQLKGSASNLKNSTTQRFQDTKSKFSSKSSATSTYDHRFPSTKAPPPPPPPTRRVGAVEDNEAKDYGAEDHHDADDGALPRPLPSGPPPVIPRNTKPVQSNSNTNNRFNSNPLVKLNEGPLPSSLNQVKWSQISQDDKEQFFGWLDEFFGINRPSSPSTSSKLEDTKQLGKSTGRKPPNHAPADSFKTSHPADTTYGSSGHDLCMYFSSSTRWDSAWYATPAAVPPPLENVRDCTRSHYTQWRGDMHTLGGGVLFSDMSACWYVVEWSKRNAQDTSQARRRATVLPRPESMSLDELVAAHETYGETVAAFAESYEGTGQWCARGECWDLASEALKSFEQWNYIPKPIPSIGKTHGHLIYEGKAWGKGQAAGRWRGGDDRIRRGDIVQWLTTTIVDGYTTFTLGSPDHTAVIVRDQIPRIKPSDGASMKPGDLIQLEVVEQSVHSPPDRKVYRLEGMTAGEVWIYRPVSMEAYLKSLFTPNWPEHMEALVEIIGRQTLSPVMLFFRQGIPKCKNYLTRFKPNNLQFVREIRFDQRKVGSIEQFGDGPNHKLLEHLLDCYKEEKVLRAPLLRFPGLLTAIKSVHRLAYPLTLKHDIKSIPDVDDYAAARIMDYLSLKKVHRRKLIEEPSHSDKIDDGKIRLLKQLQQVNGIGPIKARILLNNGCESIEQLRKERFLNLLPKPVAEIFQHEKTVSSAFTRKDGEHFMDNLSRLGHKTLNELDILLFHPSYTSLPQVLSETRVHVKYKVPNIHPISPGSLFFKEFISDPIKKSGLDIFTYSKSNDQWDGLMKINDKVIGRTRLYLLPMASKAAGLLTFTGDPFFVRNCRQRARRLSLHLNEFGLWHEGDGAQKARMQDEDNPAIVWEPFVIPDEAALLQKLNIAYVEPHKRISTNKDKYFSEKPPWHIAKILPPVLQEAA